MLQVKCYCALPRARLLYPLALSCYLIHWRICGLFLFPAPCFVLGCPIIKGTINVQFSGTQKIWRNVASQMLLCVTEGSTALPIGAIMLLNPLEDMWFVSFPCALFYFRMPNNKRNHQCTVLWDSNFLECLWIAV